MKQETEPREKERMEFGDMLESLIPQINWKLAHEGEVKRIFKQEKAGYFQEVKLNEARILVRSVFKFATPSSINALTTALTEDGERLFDLTLFKESRKRVVGFLDGVFDLQSGKFRPYGTNDFILNPLPHKLEYLSSYSKENDAWFCGILADWVGQDVADWFCNVLAYFLFIHPNDEQIWLNLFGMGSNGKSLCLKILEQILGVEKVVGCDLANLNRFSTASYLGKWLVIGRDSSSFVSDAATALIKAFTGEDRSLIERKGGDSFDEDISGKLIVSTNTLIQSKDRSYGWYRRIFPIEFPNQFKTDPAFSRMLTKRLPDILRVLLWRAYCYKNNGIQLKSHVPGDVQNLITETRYLNDRVAAYWDLSFFTEERGKKMPNTQKFLDFREKTMREVYFDFCEWHEQFFGDGQPEPGERTFCGKYGAFMQHAKDFYHWKRTEKGSTVILDVSKIGAHT